jgi:hypothetical protein
VPFTLRNLKEDLEDVGSRFAGAPGLEFRLATEALELEQSGLGFQRVPPGYRFPYGTRAGVRSELAAEAGRFPPTSRTTTGGTGASAQ